MPVNKEDPVRTWSNLLRKNKLPKATVKQLAELAKHWLKLLYDNRELTPALAQKQVQQEITDPQIRNLFDSYFFALFTLLCESDLTT